MLGLNPNFSFAHLNRAKMRGGGGGVVRKVTIRTIWAKPSQLETADEIIRTDGQTQTIKLPLVNVEN